MRVTTRLVSLLVMKAILWTTTVGEIVEGDIFIPQISLVKSYSSAADSKETKTWKDGIVPVFIDKSNLKADALIVNIKVALDTVSSQSERCVTFPDRKPSDLDYINITRIGYGCYGSVGRQGGQQIINLAMQCEPVGIIMHEILHALGFWHEHSRTDRDKYVIIYQNNIIPGKTGNFKIRNETKDIARDTAYDLKSIMHYKYDQFSVIPGYMPTIVPREKEHTDKGELGQRTHLTAIDIEKIRWMYTCLRCEEPHSDKLSISNSDKKQTYDVDDRVEFKCEYGYTLLGARSSVCKRNGNWAGSLPICVNGADNNFRVWYTASLHWNTGWKKHQCAHGILSEASGPVSDHTYADANTADGVFYYFNTKSSPNARLISRMLDKKDESEVSVVFFYSMYGSNIAIKPNLTLEVNLLYFAKFSWIVKKKVLWTRTSTTEDRSWNCEHITGLGGDITRYYTIEITAKRNSMNNDNEIIIAIDDVMVGDATYVDKFAALQQCTMLKSPEYDNPKGFGKTGMKIK